jgi:membrane associated rhomboid family serine protease
VRSPALGRLLAVVIPIHDDNPVRRTPYITYALIALNLLVFLSEPVVSQIGVGGQTVAQVCEQQAYFDKYAAIPKELVDNEPLPPHQYRVSTSTGVDTCPVIDDRDKAPFLSVLFAMFLHGGWLHLLGNMLFLHVFGDNVENRMGRIRYLLFYLAAGYLATYGYALAHAESTRTLVGASGAISGVLGSYLYLCPRARVTSLFPFLFFLPLRFPAWMVLCFWFVLQWLAAGGQGDGTPGVAYLAHVIGFVFGFVCTWVCFRRRASLDAAEPALPRATQGDFQP